ncbi:MAG: glycosyltransferase family 1 protein, partial [Negativicutes bacterium]|nr:glycosyltransferase family 1 protein [Negativicutes bacterium]
LKQNWLAFTSPNMHYLGYVDYPSLPRYLSNFTYSLIPFKLTPMTQGVNPIKLWEYLASGIPILSAPLPEIPREYVTVVSEDMFPGFVFAPSRSDRQARIQFARENSWQHRASTLYDLIIARLATG